MIRFTKFVALFCFGIFISFKGLAASRSDSLANVHLTSAMKYLSLSQHEAAFRELVTAQYLYIKSANKNGEIDVYLTFARFYAENHIWTGAQLYYQKAFLLADHPNSAIIAAELSSVLNSAGHYDQAIRFNNYSIRYFTNARDTGKLAESYIRSADIKKNLKKYGEAENLLLKTVLQLLRSAGNEAGRTSCFDVLGHLYHDQKKYSQAKWFFIQANMQSRNLKDTTGILTSLINLAKVKTDIRDYDLAIRDLKEADSLALKMNALFMLAETKKTMEIVYNKTANRQLSKKYATEYQQLNNKIAGLRNTIYTPVSEKEIERIILAQNVKAKPTDKAGVYQYFLLAIIVLILVLSILFLLSRKNKAAGRDS